jgi:hypothetical protein
MKILAYEDNGKNIKLITDDGLYFIESNYITEGKTLILDGIPPSNKALLDASHTETKLRNSVLNAIRNLNDISLINKVDELFSFCIQPIIRKG